MDDPRAFFEDQATQRLGDRIERALPEDVVVSFHILGPGGGAWEVARRDSGAFIGPIGDGPKDCQIWCSTDDFMRIIRGRLEPRRAFFDGRLVVQGDMGLALRLRGVLPAVA